MKQHTDQEIIEKMQSILDAEHAKNYCMGWRNEGCIKVKSNTADRVDIEIACMYEAPSPTYDVLMAMADFFGTMNINDDEHFSEGGCETCDYGSSYGYTLTVRNDA